MVRTALDKILKIGVLCCLTLPLQAASVESDNGIDIAYIANVEGYLESCG